MNVSGLDILGIFERIGGWLIRAALKPIKVVRKWNRVQMERRALLNMSDYMLRDIGISRVDAMQEGRRAFWRK
ncbi:DUF1127 domain-containing protein [bacterium]|nr:MAG: DUF1127 domain-containing protein [bacterium]